MTEVELDKARGDIEATADLLERAVKLSMSALGTAGRRLRAAFGGERAPRQSAEEFNKEQSL